MCNHNNHYHRVLCNADHQQDSLGTCLQQNSQETDVQLAHLQRLDVGLSNSLLVNDGCFGIFAFVLSLKASSLGGHVDA